MPTLFSSIHLTLQTLLSHQASIQVIEHNVANASTPGYRRQEAILAAGPAYPPVSMQRAQLAGQFGSGVYVQQVRRFNLEFFDGRYRKEMAEASRWELSSGLLRQVEATLSETGADGLVAKLDAFWAGWQALSADPTSLAARAGVLQRANALADGLKGRASRLIALRNDQEAAILTRVERINRLAGQVASLNAEIAGVLGMGNQPNDLLDERDRLLDELAVLAGGTVSVQEDGNALVSIGGHALVIGDTAFSLVASSASNVHWSDGSAFTPTRGELAALREAYEVQIPNQLQGLHDLANTLIERVNNLHSSGYGLNGTTGINFFSGGDPPGETDPLKRTAALTIQVNSELDELEDIAAASPDPLVPGDPQNPGDGSLAGQLAGLGSALLMGGGSQTLSAFYTSQVTRLGLEIQQFTADAQAHRLVEQNLNAQREAVSGVSLDEEAANLVKSQRAYEAAARMMTALDEMVDRIINGMGRVGL